MSLNAIAEKLKRQPKDDFKGRHFEAWLIVQAVAWYLRYPLSYRDLEEIFRERGFEVDHSTVNRWVLAYAPMTEKRLRQFRRLLADFEEFALHFFRASPKPGSMRGRRFITSPDHTEHSRGKHPTKS